MSLVPIGPAPINEDMDLSFSRRTVPPDHPAFAALPARSIRLGAAGVDAAVHVSGRLRSGVAPLVCLAGYNRNMSDFTELAQGMTRLTGDWPIVLIDLPGRGRAEDRRRDDAYGTPADARDVADVLAALGIGRAVVLGQGHGGLVAMLLAMQHPLLVAGTILVDAGPLLDSRSIVRLRTNMAHIAELKGSRAVRAGFRRMLVSSHPGLDEEALDLLALRTHWFDKRGRARPLFDHRLMTSLESFNFDDALTPQWAIFDALSVAPLMLLRTQLTDQLRRETLDEMMRRRPDADARIILGQGAPALLDGPEEIGAIVDFTRRFGIGRL